jgi:hypothetical protein
MTVLNRDPRKKVILVACNRMERLMLVNYTSPTSSLKFSAGPSTNAVIADESVNRTKPGQIVRCDIRLFVEELLFQSIQSHSENDLEK